MTMTGQIVGYCLSSKSVGLLEFPMRLLSRALYRIVYGTDNIIENAGLDNIR